MDLLSFWGEKGEKKGWEFLDCLPRTSAGSWRSQNPKISGNDPKIPEQFLRNSWNKKPRNHGVVESFYWKKFGVKTAKNGKKTGWEFWEFHPQEFWEEIPGWGPQKFPKIPQKWPRKCSIFNRKGPRFWGENPKKREKNRVGILGIPSPGILEGDSGVGTPKYFGAKSQNSRGNGSKIWTAEFWDENSKKREKNFGIVESHLQKVWKEKKEKPLKYLGWSPPKKIPQILPSKNVHF